VGFAKKMTRDSLKGSAVKAGIFLTVVFTVLVLLHVVGIRRLTPDAIRSMIGSLGWWGPAVFVLLYTVRPLLLFPSIILTLAGAMIFGPWWGTFYVVLGGLLGACLCFGISRSMGREQFGKYFSRYVKLATWDGKLAEHGFKTMLIMRLVPVFPYDPVSFLAGISKIRFSDYVLATLLGMIPGALAYNVLGYSMNDICSPVFLAAVVLLSLVLCIPLFFHFRTENHIHAKRPG
jgi:uncharacterized membrane protein YdjX (TVP38/TMEM64 family)